MKFKSAIVAFSLVAFSSLSMATDVGLAYEHSRVDSPGRNTSYNQFEATASQALGTSGFALEGKFAGQHSDLNTNSLKMQGGVVYSIVPGLYVKGGAGTVFGSARANDFNFYTAGAGAALKFQDVRFTGDYERSEAFSNSDPSWNTYKAGVEYDFLKNHTVAARYVTRTSGIRTEGFELGYNLGF